MTSRGFERISLKSAALDFVDSTLFQLTTPMQCSLASIFENQPLVLWAPSKVEDQRNLNLSGLEIAENLGDVKRLDRRHTLNFDKNWTRWNDEVCPKARDPIASKPDWQRHLLAHFESSTLKADHERTPADELLKTRTELVIDFEENSKNAIGEIKEQQWWLLGRISHNILERKDEAVGIYREILPSSS